MEPNYIQAVIDEFKRILPDLPDDLIELYALLAITWGQMTSAFEVHTAWAVWRNRTNPGHKSLIPFEDLEPDIKALDDPYVDAIRQVAINLDL